MQVILLEKIARLGSVGDVVKVKNGFARNFLIPLGKALRATEDNKSKFESLRETLLKKNAEAKVAAEQIAKTLDGYGVTVVRQAAEDGKLFGSVSVRDIAAALKEQGQIVDRSLIDLNAPIKELGLYKITVKLHAEVNAVINVHVARNADSPIPQELLEPKKSAEPSDAASEAAPAGDETEAA